ncbi:MAG: hypothetical protein KAU28_03095 [Phycisphaerae bacterium]|nr:hypothetical protein [Phycisphaerae bacterium]
MTLDELRTNIRALLLDASGGSPDYWTDARLDPLINHAMQNVGNAVVSQDAAHCYMEEDVTIANASSLPWVTVSLAAPYVLVRRLVAGYVKDYVSGPGFVDLTDLVRAHQVTRGAATLEKPPMFLLGAKIGFVYPKDAVEVHVCYVPALPYMTATGDTPGQAGGSGMANLLPVQFHHLISHYATIMCLAAMSLPTALWEGILASEAQLLGLSLVARRATPERG